MHRRPFTELARERIHGCVRARRRRLAWQPEDMASRGVLRVSPQPCSSVRRLPRVGARRRHDGARLAGLMYLGGARRRTLCVRRPVECSGRVTSARSRRVQRRRALARRCWCRTRPGAAATASLMLNLELVATVIWRPPCSASTSVAGCRGGGTSHDRRSPLVLEPGVGAAGRTADRRCMCVLGHRQHGDGQDRSVSPEQVTLVEASSPGPATSCSVSSSRADGESARASWQPHWPSAPSATASITLWVKGARDLGAPAGHLRDCPVHRHSSPGPCCPNR